MSRKPLSDRFKRSLISTGKSLCVTIPLEYLEELDWEKGQELKVRMNKKNKRIIIEEISEE